MYLPETPHAAGTRNISSLRPWAKEHFKSEIKRERATYMRAIGAVAGVPILAQLCTVLIDKGVRRRIYKGDRLVSVSLID